MNTLIKWGLRLYMLIEIARTLKNTERSSRDPRHVLDNVDHTRRTLMSLTNSPNTAIRSANQSARNAARAQVPIVRSATTALLGTVGTDTMRIGSWTIRENDHGDLVGARESGVEIVLAANPDTAPEDTPSTGENTTPAGETPVVAGSTVPSETTTATTTSKHAPAGDTPAPTSQNITSSVPTSSWTAPSTPATESNAGTTATAGNAAHPAPPIDTSVPDLSETSKHRDTSSDAKRN